MSSRCHCALVSLVANFMPLRLEHAMSPKRENPSAIQDGVSSVSTADISTNMRNALAFVAGERRWSDTREAWLLRAARACGLRYSRARAIFYGEVDRFWWDEVQAVNDAAAKRREELQETEARNAAIRLAITRNHPVRTDVDAAREVRAVVDGEGGAAERAELNGADASVRSRTAAPR